MEGMRLLQLRSILGGHQLNSCYRGIKRSHPNSAVLLALLAASAEAAQV